MVYAPFVTQPRPTDAHALIGSLQRDRASLSLSLTDLCFLVLLADHADRAALPSFEEDLLYEVFVQVCEVTEPGAQNPRKRATHAIQRLREQRLLARVDGAGLVRAGDYAMTPLATAIVDFFRSSDSLTRESLAVLTKTLTSRLAEVLTRARGATTADLWSGEVLAPLRVVIADLLAGIERRQRGLDQQQQQIRADIATLLKDDWVRAINDCQALLEQTSITLRELNEVLLEDCNRLQAQLQELLHLCEEASQDECVAAVQHLSDQLDRVSAWGRSRQSAWAEYYQYVQRYLRNVVRLDPDRALSQRLRQQLLGWLDAPFALRVAAATSLHVLREPAALAPLRPPVTQPHRDRERAPRRELPDATAQDLETRVTQALQQGDGTLTQVLARVLPTLPRESRYRDTGRIAALCAAHAQVHAERLRPVVDLSEALPGLQVEDWVLRGLRGDSR